jgi:ribosomal subunit interface protein
MQLHIESPYVEISQHLKQLTQKKFSHLGRKFSRVSRCEVVFRNEKNAEQKSFFAEATVAVPGTVLFASERDTAFEIALETLLNNLERQLEKRKEEPEKRS